MTAIFAMRTALRRQIAKLLHGAATRSPKGCIAAALLGVSTSVLAQAITFDSATGIVNIPSVRVGGDTYVNVTLKITDPASYSFALQGATLQTPPGPAIATYDGASAILTLPSVAVGTATYLGVTLLNTGSYNFRLQTATEQSPPTACGSGGCSVAGPSGVGLTVPAGAIAQSTGIAITAVSAGTPELPSALTPAGQKFAFTPHGTMFAQPVTITVPFDPGQVPAGATPALYKTNAQWAWEPVAGSVVSGNSMSGQVTSFSYVVVGFAPPTVVVGPRIAAGNRRAFARNAKDQLYAWGWDFSEGLGNGTTTADVYSPLASPITDARTVATGSSSQHALAVLAGGGLGQGLDGVWGWGSNGAGQLGDGSKTNRATAVRMVDAGGSPITDAKAVAAGFLHSLVLLKNGTVLATGRNLHGQLGDGFATDVDRIRAAPVTGLSDVVAIAAGGDLSIALRADGTVWTWGDNRLGQLGIGSTDFQRDVPMKVDGLPTITAIAAGGGFGLALATNGELWAWGYNFSGELGDGSSVTSRNVPGKVSIAGKVTAMSGGLQHALALRDDGTVWAWGANVLGEVGVETQPLPLQQVRTPAQVSNLSGIREISAGYALSLAIDSNGDLWSWGGNLQGELGLGTKYNDPVNPGPRQYTTPQKVNLNLN